MIDKLKSNPPDPLHSNRERRAAAKSARDIGGRIYMPLQSLALLGLLVLSFIAPGVDAQFVIGASTFSVLNKNIDAFSDVDVSITKDATSDDWASNRCFTMTVHNPYEDKSLYKSFSQEPGE
jgi:hypothetical protein